MGPQGRWCEPAQSKKGQSVYHQTAAKQENVPSVARVFKFSGETRNLIYVFLLIKNVLFKFKNKTNY